MFYFFISIKRVEINAILDGSKHACMPCGVLVYHDLSVFLVVLLNRHWGLLLLLALLCNRFVVPSLLADCTRRFHFIRLGFLLLSATWLLINICFDNLITLIYLLNSLLTLICVSCLKWCTVSRYWYLVRYLWMHGAGWLSSSFKWWSFGSILCFQNWLVAVLNSSHILILLFWVW